MASLLGNPSIRFGEGLVGHVLPRIRVGHRQTETTARYDASRIGPFAPHVFGDERQTTGALLSLADTTRAIPTNAHSSRVTGKRKLPNYYNTPVRRQQCRTNQARYRDRQRAAQLQLENSVRELHQEVNDLKRQYRGLSSRERSTQSPWSIVAEVFRLLESSLRSPWRLANTQEMKTHTKTQQSMAFLEKAFAFDAAMGGLTGVDKLLEQLRFYSQYFGEPHLKLERIESAVSGVMVATAKLSVTVTKLTLQHIFPHLCDIVADADEEDCSLYNYILGKRFEYCCSLRFLFDDESGRVVRLETQIDVVAGMLRSLRNLKDVSDVLEHALITSECVISSGLRVGQNSSTH